MRIAIVTRTRDESHRVAARFANRTREDIIKADRDFICTKGYIFFCMSSDNVHLQAIDLSVDVVWISGEAYSDVYDDSLKTEAIWDMCKLGPEFIIVAGEDADA